MLNKKNRFKPLYKQLINLRENVQSRKKLLNFKSKKWEKFQDYYEKKQRWYRKYKTQDHSRYLVSMYAHRKASIKKWFKNTLNSSRVFRLLYGNLSKNFVKQRVRQIFDKKSNKNENFKRLLIQLFEQRLDTILYRSKFCISFRNARQIITHGQVFVNKLAVKTPSYRLKPGDLVSIAPNYYKVIDNNLKTIQIWPIPPKYLSINYKTMEILCNSSIKHTDFSTNFTFYINFEKIILGYLYH